MDAMQSSQPDVTAQEQNGRAQFTTNRCRAPLATQDTI